MSGSVSGSVLQTGALYGDVHIHSSPTPVVPRQLPPAPDLFAGREAELADLDRALDAGTTADTALVISAIGAGGIGKTWLALAWANRHADQFPDGQLFADLRGYNPDGGPRQPDVVVRRFLEVLNVDPARVPNDVEAQAGLYRSMVADRRMLILLDNAADTDQVTPLLPGGTSCRVVVTSRNRLSGLITRHGARSLRLDALDDAEARALLARRLGPSRTKAESPAVAELVRLCGGFPLALGIVAARAHSDPEIPLADFVTELRESTMDALDDGEPAASLSAVLSLSYRTLTVGQRRVLTLLSAAPGADISLPAAVSLTGLSVPAARKALRVLEHASLLERRPGDRYAIHDLIRDYARGPGANHVDSTELERALERLVDFYRRNTHTADRLLHFDTPSSPRSEAPHLTDRAAALGWLRAERDNLAAVLDDVTARDRTADLVDLTASLAAFWQQDSPGDRAASRHRRAVEACRKRGDFGREANALIDLGRMRHLLGEYGPAARAYKRAEKLFDGLGDHVGLATTLNCIGNLRQVTDDHWGSVPLYERALKLFRTADHRPGEARSLANLGTVHQIFGKYSRATNYLEQALELYRELGDEQGQADVLLTLGRVKEGSEDSPAAAELYAAALRLHKKLEDRAGQANALLLLGGTGGRAAERSGKALELFRELGIRHGVGNALTQLASTKSAVGEYDEANQLLREAMSVWEELGHLQGKGNALLGRGELLLRIGEFEDADRLFGNAFELFVDLQDRIGKANIYYYRGVLRAQTGDRPGAERFYRKAYDQWHELDSRSGQAQALNSIGALLRHSEPESALEAHRQALAVPDQSPYPRARTLEAIAQCEATLGNWPSALAALRESLALHRRLDTEEAASVAKKLTAWESQSRDFISS